MAIDPPSPEVAHKAREKFGRLQDGRKQAGCAKELKSIIPQ
jgi:hypothetical protein